MFVQTELFLDVFVTAVVPRPLAVVSSLLSPCGCPCFVVRTALFRAVCDLLISLDLSVGDCLKVNIFLRQPESRPTEDPLTPLTATAVLGQHKWNLRCLRQPSPRALEAVLGRKHLPRQVVWNGGPVGMLSTFCCLVK